MLMAATYKSRTRASVNRLNVTARPFQINLVVSRTKAEKQTHNIAPILPHKTYKFLLDWLEIQGGHDMLNSVNLWMHHLQIQHNFKVRVYKNAVTDSIDFKLRLLQCPFPGLSFLTCLDYQVCCRGGFQTYQSMGQIRADWCVYSLLHASAFYYMA